MAAIDASWVSGCENWRAYWIIACMSPMFIVPLEIFRPPTTAIRMNWMLPRKIVIGWMRLDMNCAPKLASYITSLSARNRSSASRWRPKLLTIVCPVNTSSACALSAPVYRHCAMKRGRALPAMNFIMNSDTGTAARAITARIGEITNIMMATPIIVRIDVRICEIVCCRLCDRLSMSLVTRLSRSPRGWLSMYLSGSRLSLCSTDSRSRYIERCTTPARMYACV